MPVYGAYNQESIVRYTKGICPVAERMHYEELISHGLVYKGVSKSDLKDIVHAYEKALAAVPVLARPCLDPG